MVSVRSVLILLMCAAGGLSFSKVPAYANCDDLITHFNSTIQGRSISDAKVLEGRIAVDAACGERLIEVQRRRAALQILLAQELIDAGRPVEAYEDLVVDADRPDVLWRAAVALADIRFRQRRFDQATQAYERALETIKNPSRTPKSPSEQDIKAIFDRAAEARLLAANARGLSSASHYVSAAKDQRDGSVGGTFSVSIRGFRPKSVPVPVGFETASAKFTPVGEQAAKELVEALRQQAPKEITLVGHTDERGTEGYNMELSVERVKALAEYLRQNGVGAKIVTMAKGKTEPLQLSGTDGLSREDVWALNRRVEWKRD